MPKQLTKTLGDFNVSTDILRQGFVSLAGNKPELNDLGIIFEVGLTDLSLLYSFVHSQIAYKIKYFLIVQTLPPCSSLCCMSAMVASRWHCHR